MLSGLQWLPVGLVIPVLVLMLRARGLELPVIGGLFAVYTIVVIVLELPTGSLADVLGRRHTLVLSRILYGRIAAWARQSPPTSCSSAIVMSLGRDRAGAAERPARGVVRRRGARRGPGGRRTARHLARLVGRGGVPSRSARSSAACCRPSPTELVRRRPPDPAVGPVPRGGGAPGAGAGRGAPVPHGRAAERRSHAPVSQHRARRSDRPSPAGLRLAGSDRTIRLVLGATAAFGFALPVSRSVAPVQFAIAARR